MWPWKKSKEEFVEFQNYSAISSDFIPLGYITDNEKRKVEIVGTNHERRQIVVVAREKDEYTVRHRIDTPIVVDYIVSIDIINREKKREYIAVSRIAGAKTENEHKGVQQHVKIKTKNSQREEKVQYSITKIDETGHTLSLGISDSMPFLITHKDLDPALFVQKDGETFFLDIAENVKYSSKEPFGVLRNNHSSGFVDVSGNGIADLVLDTVKNGKRTVEVWSTNNGEYTLTGSLDMSDESSGPFVFGDFTGTGAMDILYLSNDQPSINIIPNMRPAYCTNGSQTSTPLFTRDKNSQSIPCLFKSDIMKASSQSGYSAEDKITYNIEDISEFKLYDSNGPVFPSVLDINSNTYPDIIVLAQKNNAPSFQPSLFLNEGGTGFTHEDAFDELPGKVKMAAFYREDKGVWNVLASSLVDSSSTLFIYRNTSDISGYYLSISTKIEREKGSHVPAIGASYACRITETGRVIVGSYPAQSGYVTMQSPVTVLGLGRTNVFISSLHSRVPNEKYRMGIAQDKIVPNSELMMEVTNNHIRNSLYLNANAYWPIAIPVILTILFTLVIITAYFSMKTKRYTKNKTKRTRYDVTFGAL
ncbi:integrin alpha FG-GAP repeat containing protein 1 [Nematocida minor]|uniref:integrin alpha FG-GAP repeat containing protein 1 n=1 Tax=Nematocida minor TaxID=1912983 RepID=UPI00221F944D|nr:integrin alpha FG-GAP repeat containing protein 1 [Nematocida minor]KAI5192340.1 integrin alpha FG-GAP repeat containing protein 1 [Nematocida minor]